MGLRFRGFDVIAKSCHGFWRRLRLRLVSRDGEVPFIRLESL